ncbi:ArsR/SmtB family transcription factor [Mesobacillus foraminis]|uniref:Putative transcriptional regulator n=1 Tax=Mesobacillus foraminis TaxID=279826 RepID=A0A4R2B5L6_9BACI|nr:helix-turn-helix domain-containing protein [Mesobacillus foraminis]TCN21142.1 putative transcriptional regulator [Mesobacillus foraminis]
MRTLQLTLEEAIVICKALSNEHRMNILEILTSGPLNVNDLAEMMDLPFSTTAVNIKKLEDAGLISTEQVPGRGMQKVSSKRYDQIIIKLRKETHSEENVISIDMPIGEYTDCEVEPTCGLVSDTDFLGVLDDPRTFYETDRKNAELIWFRSGFIEYRFPNRVPDDSKCDQIEIMAELCSEAPYHKFDWPSDITVWVNGIEIGTWTCPGDFGGERGNFTPEWWLTENTQFGLLKTWTINKKGSFVDGVRLSDVTLMELSLHSKPYISIKFGVKKDALNSGGMNLFGHRFGNHEQGILLKIFHSSKI